MTEMTRDELIDKLTIKLMEDDDLTFGIFDVDEDEVRMMFDDVSIEKLRHYDANYDTWSQRWSR